MHEMTRKIKTNIQEERRENRYMFTHRQTDTERKEKKKKDFPKQTTEPH
jgi:divalent metal cation (Fe/Co/Zn/Cd) transporter